MRTAYGGPLWAQCRARARSAGATDLSGGESNAPVSPRLPTQEDGAFYIFFGGIWGGQLQRWNTQGDSYNASAQCTTDKELTLTLTVTLTLTLTLTLTPTPTPILTLPLTLGAAGRTRHPAALRAALRRLAQPCAPASRGEHRPAAHKAARRTSAAASLNELPNSFR